MGVGVGLVKCWTIRSSEDKVNSSWMFSSISQNLQSTSSLLLETVTKWEVMLEGALLLSPFFQQGPSRISSRMLWEC